ncbi:plastocyanin/azurin family copper-binding protein [Maribacter sp. ACAM166]|uniref:plastocyanin/azurin family copper-binding protein n=1 Tax=Maribacter sp. ACAM166 TaxID=2508996 RepID=UPI0010FE94AE|nr:plastocyanin/azurin family copper-binding protein [Maribacter sp. ACAM166]TLP81443.1 auracyanin family protein [Maribacter sp. ACAM166]
MKVLSKTIATVCIALITSFKAIAQQSEMAKKEAKYYQIVDVPIPEDVQLEVGGLALTNENKLGVSTRHGEVWVIDKPYSQKPIYTRFAHGLHEPLGLAWRDGGFYATQRAELTRLEDTDNNGKADLYKSIYHWPLSGNYHEYSYGPKFLKNGNMLLTLNLSWENRAISLAKWRGWLVQITPEGEMTPIATGLRSPAGFEINDNDEVFYTENQGEWVGSGRMTHLEKGDFAGNAEGLVWSGEPNSPLTLKKDDVEPESGLTLYEYAKKVPALKVPAIWFPHTILGISTSDMIYDKTGGKFGPFEGQIFVGDQGHSKIMRVFMEKVNGVYQGAAFNFVEGFSSGILRMIWGQDNSMFVGMTSRGWTATGTDLFGLQRLVWNGKTPFEIKTMKAQDDGFVLEFTKPVNKTIAANPATYQLTTFSYKYQYSYGSPIIDQQKAMVHKATVAEDGLSVKLTVHGMRLGFIHQLTISDIKATNGEKLLHDTGYYTLNEVPGGKLKSASMEKSETKGLAQAKRIQTMPTSWTNGPDQQLVLGTKPGLKFDIEELTLEAGKKVEITFNNNDDMLHNLVITTKGKESVDEVAQLALRLGLDGADMNYVPDSDLVLAHTGILEPRGTQKLFFEVPAEPGVYWMVCTFPGHATSMRVKVTVTAHS